MAPLNIAYTATTQIFVYINSSGLFAKGLFSRKPVNNVPTHSLVLSPPFSIFSTGSKYFVQMELLNHLSCLASSMIFHSAAHK